MINAWSLLYDEMNGTMDKTYPIKNTEGDEDIKITTGIGNTIFNVPEDVEIDEDIPEVVTVGGADEGVLNIDGGDTINFDDYVLGDSAEYDTLNLNIPDPGVLYGEVPPPQNFLADNDDAAAHHFTTPGIEKDCPRKYKEDESIEALKNYISTTYGGHYTSDNNNVQTLDLIESVGDAESFCRSNAIKYLSRYDKKGQAKRDILKALHYSLLLYHFSGQLNETTTRGYETF